MSNQTEFDEADIYCDLPNFHFDEAFKRLEEEKLELQTKVEDLGAKLDEMKKQNEKLVAKVKSLGKNISCLYKTAQRELQRKEQIIADLRKERDDLLFRRGLKDDKTATNKRPSRKQLTPTKKVRNGNIKRLQYNKPKNYIGLKEENASPVGEDCEINNSFIKSCSKTETPKNSHVTADVGASDTGAPTNNFASVEFCSQEEFNGKTSSVFEDVECAKAHARIEISAIIPDPESNNQVTASSETKFSVHMSSEDCGFGQRRRIRRVLKANTSVLTAVSPPKCEDERKGVKHSPDRWRKPEVIEMDQVAKRSRLQSDSFFRLHSVIARETPNECNSLPKEGEPEPESILTESQDVDILAADTAMSGSKCISSNASKVFQKGVDELHLEQNGLTEKGLSEKRDSHLVNSKNEPESGNSQKSNGPSFSAWERERVISYESLNGSPDSDRRERHSDGDSEIGHRGREKDWRKDSDQTRGLDHRKSRDKNVSQHQGQDRVRMRSSSRGDGSSRDRRGRHSNQSKDQNSWRDRDEDQRRVDSVKRFSKDCRDIDELDRRTRGSSRDHKSNRGVWGGYLDRDRPRRDLEEERERNVKWRRKTLYHKDRIESRNPVHCAARTPDDVIHANRSVTPEWD